MFEDTLYSVWQRGSDNQVVCAQARGEGDIWNWISSLVLDGPIIVYDEQTL